jgi:hypothetical protein
MVTQLHILLSYVDGKYIKDQQNDHKSMSANRLAQLNKSECAKMLRLSVCEGAHAR